MHVRGAEVEPVPVEGDAAPDRRRDARRKRPVVAPDQVAGPGVEGLDRVPHAGHEHDAVAHQRGRQAGARRQGPAPGKAKAVDVGPVDLLERAESLGVVGPPPGQPVFRRGGGERGVGHRPPAGEPVRAIAPDQRRGVGRGLHVAPAGERHPAQPDRIGGQLGGAGRHCVGLRDIGQDVGGGGRRKDAGVLRRHGADGGPEDVQALSPVFGQERGPFQRRCERPVAQACAVTGGAAPVVGGLAPGRLGGGVAGGRARRRGGLLGAGSERRGGERCAREEEPGAPKRPAPTGRRRVAQPSSFSFRLRPAMQ